MSDNFFMKAIATHGSQTSFIFLRGWNSFLGKTFLGITELFIPRSNFPRTGGYDIFRLQSSCNSKE